MTRLPERWTLLRDGEPTQDPLTGNRIDGPPIEVPWWGLLQKRSLTDLQVEEFEDGRASQRLILLLDPGLPGGTDRRDRWRFDGPASVADLVKVGDIVTVQGTPRNRRPARGSRRPAYIAAVVRHSSDLKE
ncbi:MULTISPECIES: hypothetical protein [Nocardia]|uniref:Uncharacterized protein n=1 Tax=Nocardia farcinica (strain IFM 10152) TaxID=247156 RepID=Q5YZL5_NOCFA|nr:MULTISPECIES: hypothetical protein [Nocardia]PEH74637.1 hypothetical protein CRM89_00355 [Nocardia sp. FDAARGOS_372]BAD56376.1 hypothetical protein NFA_15310 [Nocardia farcinica IFM 10152]